MACASDGAVQRPSFHPAGRTRFSHRLGKRPDLELTVISTQHNQPLAKAQRTQLENTVKAAREAAETGALAALSQLAVGEARVPSYLSEEQRALRRRLRAHSRALGDRKADDDSQSVQQLVW